MMHSLNNITGNLKTKKERKQLQSFLTTKLKHLIYGAKFTEIYFDLANFVGRYVWLINLRFVDVGSENSTATFTFLRYLHMTHSVGDSVLTTRINFFGYNFPSRVHNNLVGIIGQIVVIQTRMFFHSFHEFHRKYMVELWHHCVQPYTVAYVKRRSRIWSHWRRVGVVDWLTDRLTDAVSCNGAGRSRIAHRLRCSRASGTRSICN